MSRRAYPIGHPRVTQLRLEDFTALDAHERALSGFYACFVCAG